MIFDCFTEATDVIGGGGAGGGEAVVIIAGIGDDVATAKPETEVAWAGIDLLIAGGIGLQAASSAITMGSLAC